MNIGYEPTVVPVDATPLSAAGEAVRAAAARLAVLSDCQPGPLCQAAHQLYTAVETWQAACRFASIPANEQGRLAKLVRQAEECLPLPL